MIRALLTRARRRDHRKTRTRRPGVLEQTMTFPTAIITGPVVGDPLRDPVGTRRWANPDDPHPWAKVGRDRWQHLGSLAIRRDHQVAHFSYDRMRWWPFEDWGPPASTGSRTPLQPDDDGRPW